MTSTSVIVQWKTATDVKKKTTIYSEKKPSPIEHPTFFRLDPFISDSFAVLIVVIFVDCLKYILLKRR